jgi:hypothetical protein
MICDPTTVEEIVVSIEKKPGRANRIWVMDRGMVSEANLKWVKRVCGSPRNLLDELARIKTGDVVLPAQNADGSSPRTVRLRCVTEPDADQKMLLHRLGLTLPRRLRSTEPARQM